MNSTRFERWTRGGALALCIALGLSLAACGGGDDDDGDLGTVRLVNLATGYASLDLYSSDTKLIDAVPVDSASGKVQLASGSYTFKLKRAGAVASASSESRTLAASTAHTIVAYTSYDTLKSVLLIDSADTPTAGTARFRVLNLAPEAGNVDVYLTDVGVALGDQSANVVALGGESTSSYTEYTAGRYRIQVTAAGSKTDLRLDIPDIRFVNGQNLTLVLTATRGGVLVHGDILQQGGEITAAKNTWARVRAVAGTTANGQVSLTVNGTAVASGLRSPSVGSYVLVAAGTAVAPTVTVDGAAVATASLSLTAGADVSLAVLGAPGSAQVARIDDDNRPSNTAANANIRLFNGINNLGVPISLTVDYSTLASDVAFASASTPGGITAGDSMRLEATAPVGTGTLYLGTGINLQRGRVYTLFMLGDSATPVGILRRDR